MVMFAVAVITGFGDGIGGDIVEAVTKSWWL